MKSLVSINGRYVVHRVTGMQRYATEVRKRLGENTELISPSSAAKGISGHLWEQLTLPYRFSGRVLWSPCNTGPLAVARQVVTIHDIFPIDHPEWFARQFVLLYSQVIPLLLKRVEHLIAVSAYTKARLVRRFRLDPDKVTVIHNGVDAKFRPRSASDIKATRDRLGLGGGKYVLSVCSLEPRKNLNRLLEAWQIISAAHPETKLVIAGAKGRPGVFHQVDLSINPKNVIFSDYVPEEDLPALYAGAECFAYPSLDEGFGLPVLEALACGTAVVASNRGSISDLVGSHATLIDPLSPTEIANAIRSKLEDSPKGGQEAARHAHAQQFTWERCATTTRNLLLSFC